jgi:uncharacterized protein YbcI
LHLSEQSDACSSPVVAEISREIIGIHADRFGQWPTVESTVWREEILICMLRDVFTRNEQVLIDAGRFEQVRANRQVIEEAVEPQLRQAVERASGSRVRAVLHEVSAEGAACEIFLLEQAAHQ